MIRFEAMSSDGLFRVTIKVELDDGSSREEVRWATENTINNVDYEVKIAKMYNELLEPNPL